MFKFIKQYAETIRGVDIYPIVSLFIFLFFFIAVLWYVKRIDKSQVDKMSNLPLDLSDDNSLANSIKQA